MKTKLEVLVVDEQALLTMGLDRLNFGIKGRCELDEIYALETAPHIALRDFSKEAVGESQCIRFW